MSIRTAELLAGIGLLVFSLGLMWNVYSDGLNIGWVDGRGPGAGVWPFWLSFGMALTCLWTIVRWFRGTTPESRDVKPYIPSGPLALVTISFVSLTAMVYLVDVIGTYIAIALFLGFYMRIVGKHTWVLTIISVIGAVVFIYFLFEWQLTKYLPKGLPVFEDAFLWLDNFRWKYLM